MLISDNDGSCAPNTRPEKKYFNNNVFVLVNERNGLVHPERVWRKCVVESGVIVVHFVDCCVESPLGCSQ